MNLPNKLTLLRVLMIPVCLALLYFRRDIAAAVVFALACFTDYLDGYIARRSKIVTNFGKFADPVADKILVITVMVMLLYQARFPLWALSIVVARELAVDGLRLVAVEKGIGIAARSLGKWKTGFQMAVVLAAIINAPVWLVTVLAGIMSLLTIVSGAQYFYEGRKVMDIDEHSASA